MILDTVDAALAEDAPGGDITSYAFVPEDAVATADLVARETGVFAGVEVFGVAMTRLDDRVTLGEKLAADGALFAPGDVLATVSGPARAILQAERVALNFVQRMSGIATMTAAYVAAAGPGVRVLDTRKTTPLLRAFEKHAVVCGGGHNHRFNLSDAAMAKDNHLAVLLDQFGGDLTAAIKDAATRLPHPATLEIEVDRLDQIEPVLASGVVDTIMLDNFTLDELREGVRLVAGRASIEASGGVTLETIGAIAATGVDTISVGALTHHIESIDLGLDVRVK